MSGSIQFTNPANAFSWECTFDNVNESHNLKEICFEDPYVPFYIGCLIPIRTNNWSNFSQDFFYPTTHIVAVSKSDTLGRKIIIYLGAIFLDLITFPIRLVTCIPRAFYNAYYESTLSCYLKKHNAPANLLKDTIRLDAVLKVKYGTGSWPESKTFAGTAFLMQIPAPTRGFLYYES